MPANQKNLEVANLVVKFGDDLALMDMFEETVRPAFFDKKLVRAYGESTYLLNRPTLVALDEKTVGIAGRLVKDTVLEQEQVLRDGKLTPAGGKLESAPSSFFLLVLNSHRLLYVKEHKGSPSIETFKSTISLFLKVRHKQFIDKRYLELKEFDEDKVTKKQLVEEFPYPKVNLQPIATKVSVENFIDRYERLESVTTKILETNSEVDNEGLFEDLRSAQDRINSRTTTLKFENKEGLNKNEAAEQISVLARQGNHEIKMNGLDEAGDRLKGNNENFKLEIHVPWSRAPLVASAKKLFAKFTELAERNIIIVPKTPAKVLLKIESITENMSK